MYIVRTNGTHTHVFVYVCASSQIPIPEQDSNSLTLSLFLSFVCLRVCNTLALECCKGNTQPEIPYYIYCIYYNLSSELAGALYINIKAQLTFIHTFFFDFLGDAKVKAPSSECDTLVSPFPSTLLFQHPERGKKSNKFAQAL